MWLIFIQYCIKILSFQIMFFLEVAINTVSFIRTRTWSHDMKPSTPAPSSNFLIGSFTKIMKVSDPWCTQRVNARTAAPTTRHGHQRSQHHDLNVSIRGIVLGEAHDHTPGRNLQNTKILDFFPLAISHIMRRVTMCSMHPLFSWALAWSRYDLNHYCFKLEHRTIS